MRRWSARAEGPSSGSIRFRGEGGYTRVDAVRAPGTVILVRHLQCQFGARKQAGHGAELDDESDAIDLVAFADDPQARPVCFVVGTDKVGRVLVFHLALLVPGPGAFTFSHDLTSAHLDLPPPFAGAGNFAAPHSMTGSLTISFPGAPDVPLTGPGFTATLKRLGPGKR